MKQSLYMYNSGELRRKDNTLRFISYEGEKRDIPIERISDIYIISEMSFNTAFINYISQYGIPIHFLTIIITIQEATIRGRTSLPESCLSSRYRTT